ncbi:MAG: hypothetical protein K1X91_00010 [Bacteriodetes bacterium]|nr:hypothetical protein [Bacteroidota bacterium]
MSYVKHIILIGGIIVLMHPVVVCAQGSTTQQGIRFIHPNSTTNAISLVPPSSITSYTLTLPGTQGAASSYLMNDGSGNLSWQTLSSSTALSGITAATATNSINSSNFGQTWAWNTLAGTSALTLSSTSTAAASNAQTLLNISLSGANATATQTTYGMQVANTHTGTSSTNIAGYFTASGGTNNYGLIVASGNVGIGTTTPNALLDVKGNVLLTNGGTASELRLYEPSASGSNYTGFKAQAQTADVTYTLPAADGTSGYALTTNGSGTLSWAAVANSSTAWMRAGNSSTTPGTDFVGTTDAQDLMFKVNNTERFTLKQSTGFLHLNQTNQNTMMGYQVANASPSGGANTGIGYQSLYNLTTGASNVALGFVAMSQNQTGSHNTALGTVALNANTGSYNVGIGSWSGYWMTGSNNTVIGYLAGYNHTNGNWNIFIGDSTTIPASTTGSNLLNIGNSIYGTNISTASPKIGIATSSIASGATLDVRGHIALSNAGSASELRLYEPSASGSNYTAFKAQAQTADVTYTLPAADGTSGYVLTTNGSGTLTWSAISASTALSGITAATGTNSINSSNYGQTWQWNTLAGTSALTLSSTSTAAASNAQTLLNIALSGANATASQITYGMQVANTHTGSGTNIAGYFSASGGTNNYALVVPSGYVGIGTATPSKPLDVIGNLSNSNILSVTNQSNSGYSSVDFMNDVGALSSTFGFANSGTGGIFSGRAYMNSYNNDFVLTRNSSEYSIFIQGSSGNIGLGTNNPVTKLDVTGTTSLSNTGTASELRFYEPSGSGSNYTAFKAGTQSANVTYTLPTSVPTTNQYLESDASGNLSWKFSPQFIRKTADESLSSNTTLQDDDELQFSVGANETWEIIADLDVYGASGAIKVAITISSGTLHVYTFQEGNGTEQGEWLTSSGTANTNAITVVDAKTIVNFKGLIITGGTGGTVKIRWAQNSSSGTTTVKANSYMVVKRWQ